MVTLSLKPKDSVRPNPKFNHFAHHPFDLKRYHESLAGVSRMSASSCLFFSCVRNIDSQRFEKNAEQLHNLTGYFAESSVWLFENDSTADFVEATKAVSKKYNFNVINAKYGIRSIGEGRSDERINNYCFFRNHLFSIYKKYIKRKYDYIIILDMDLQLWRLDGVFQSFGVNKQWDMIGANGIQLLEKSEVYYDTFAYIDRNWQMPQQGVDIPVFRFNDEFIPVKSCFGGLGIYREEAFLSAKKYVPRTMNGRSLNEHGSLHMAMREKNFTRLYINPNMIVIR
jgi:hypothetical protein